MNYLEIVSHSPFYIKMVNSNPLISIQICEILRQKDLQMRSKTVDISLFFNIIESNKVTLEETTISRQIEDGLKYLIQGKRPQFLIK